MLSALKFTFMGALGVRKGEWGAFTDLIYVDLGGSKSGSREFSAGNLPPPADVNANASLDFYRRAVELQNQHSGRVGNRGAWKRGTEAVVSVARRWSALRRSFD